MTINPSPEWDAVYRIPEIFVSRFRLQVGVSSRLTISLGFSRASFTISRLRKRSYARPSSLPRPVKAQPHCVRELNQELNKEENDRASKLNCRCVVVSIRHRCASRSSNTEKWRPAERNHRQV